MAIRVHSVLNKLGKTQMRSIIATVALLTVAVVAIAFALAYAVGPHWPWHSHQPLELWKTALLATAGLGGAAGLVVAYRRQNVLEEQHKSTLERQISDDKINEGRRFTEQFTAATAQLGDPSLITRLAGAYAMAAVADEWASHQQTAIDVLCAYLRLPYASARPTGSEPSTATQASSDPPSDQEVRITIIRLIRDHLLPPVRHSEATQPKPHVPVAGSGAWSQRSFDFRGASFDDIDLTGTVFRGAAHFNMATFNGLAAFEQATFSGPTDFQDAEFYGRTIFRAATFSGPTRFDRAMFADADLSASFSGFTSFAESKFNAVANFGNAMFSGRTCFVKAQFYGFTFFHGSSYAAEADFREAVFSGTADFRNTVFSGDTDFRNTVFSGPATHFAESSFSNAPHTDNAVFTSPDIDFDRVNGPHA